MKDQGHRMNRPTRRSFLLGLGATAVTTGLLQACGGESDDGDDTAEPTQTPSGGVTTDATPESEDSSDVAPTGESPADETPSTEETSSSGEDLPGATLVIRSVGEVADLVPLTTSGRPDTMITDIIYSKLVFTYPDAPLELVPDLAEKWEWSSDGLELTLRLRQGAQWHKGYGEVTSANVVWSLNRIQDPNLAIITAPAFANMVDVVAEDDYTVRLTLGEPEPLFMHTALVPSSDVINQRALEEKGDAYSSDPVGSGSYIFDEWIRGQEVILIKNPDHWLHEGNLETAHFPFLADDTVAELALRSGELDVSYFETTETQRAVVDNPDLTVLQEPSARVHQVYFSMHEGAPTTDVRVRRALAISLNRELIAEEALDGMAFPAHTMFNPKMPGYLDTEFFPYDPEQAKQLLAEAGYADGLEFEAITYNVPPSGDILTIVAGQWEAIGINVTVNVLERALAFERWQNRDFEVLMLPLGRPLPEEAIGQYYTSTGIPYPNSAMYTGIDDLMAELASTPVEERIDIYHQIQEKLVEDVVSIPVVYPSTVLGMRQGIEPFDVGIFWYPLWLFKIPATE